MTKAFKKRLSSEALQDTLCEIVDRSGLTRYEIAIQTDLSESSLSKHYNRLTTPSPEYLNKLASKLGVNVYITIEWKD